ncbi:MAG TPA: hypothetical protein VGY56_07405 [Verrucomicrobiae bacterium]|nr:hypothetical protein [Verrucomicrobiae bacterium]
MKNDDDINSQKRSAAYARNADGRPNCFIGEQMAAIREYAQRRELEIVKTYADGGEAD